MNNDTFLMTTDAARILKRSAEAVRAYERAGKLAAIKTSNGHRLFKESDVRALAAKLKVSGEVRDRESAVNE